jgi:HNH endonuclease/AP2 domain
MSYTYPVATHILGCMAYIQARNGPQVQVDEEDIERLLSPHLKGAHSGWYVRKDGYVYLQLQIPMHRMLVDAPKGMEVDHINGDRLDNRKENLRVVYRWQNRQNTVYRHPGTSQYRGVGWDKSRNKWIAGVQIAGKRYNFGRFDDELEAARAAEEGRARLMKYHNEARHPVPKTSAIP